MSEFIMKRKDNYWWEVTLVKLGKPFIIFLTHTSVTPNMITLINLIIMLPLICLMAWEKSFFALALMVQIYMFLDIVDGNLARNKHMQSELGEKIGCYFRYTFLYGGVFFHWIRSRGAYRSCFDGHFGTTFLWNDSYILYCT